MIDQEKLQTALNLAGIVTLLLIIGVSYFVANSRIVKK
jgi:hypothetical protein